MNTSRPGPSSTTCSASSRHQAAQHQLWRSRHRPARQPRFERQGRATRFLAEWHRIEQCEPQAADRLGRELHQAHQRDAQRHALQQLCAERRRTLLAAGAGRGEVQADARPAEHRGERALPVLRKDLRHAADRRLQRDRQWRRCRQGRPEAVDRRAPAGRFRLRPGPIDRGRRRHHRDDLRRSDGPSVRLQDRGRRGSAPPHSGRRSIPARRPMFP